MQGPLKLIRSTGSLKALWKVGFNRILAVRVVEKNNMILFFWEFAVSEGVFFSARKVKKQTLLSQSNMCLNTCENFIHEHLC